MMLARAAFALTLLAVHHWSSGPAIAGSEDVVVERAWARASIGTSRPGAAYMTIRNDGTETMTLTGLQTDLSTRSEIHRTSMTAQGVTSMAPAGEIEVRPGDLVDLKPGGLHVMLMGLKHPMVKGETFTLTLVFSDDGKVVVDVPILSIGARGLDD